MANCYLLLIGSIITVPEVPKSTLLELIRTGRYADWAEHPELLASGIEEALRWGTSANHVLRYATRTIELRGRRINEGDAVVVWYPSGNRDDEVFADPYLFDIRRQPNRHLSFGSGPHYCVGFGIARLTLRLLFEGMFASFQEFEVAGEVKHLRSNFIAGITSMPVMGHPARSHRGGYEGVLRCAGR